MMTEEGAACGRRVGGAWAACGRRVGNVWAECGQRVDGMWTARGRRVDGAWAARGQRVGGVWATCGRRVGGAWTACGWRVDGVWVVGRWSAMPALERARPCPSGKTVAPDLQPAHLWLRQECGARRRASKGFLFSGARRRQILGSSPSITGVLFSRLFLSAAPTAGRLRRRCGAGGKIPRPRRTPWGPVRARRRSSHP